jgi:putative spermidine/putrescine transport system permease protein
VTAAAATVAAIAPGAAPRWRRRARLALLLGPGTLLILGPFVASLVVLAGYSLEIGARDAAGPGLDAWHEFLGDGYSWYVIWTSVRLGFVVTAITLVIAYPTACALARLRRPALAGIAYVILFSPLLMSVVVRSYGWLLLLADRGFINTLLGASPLGLGPYRLLYNETGVVIALVHILLPFAVLPLVSVVLQIPEIYREAAFDLGGTRLTVFLKVTLPLTLPGVVVAAEIVFALAISAFVTPSVLGGGRVLVLSRLIYDNIGNVAWALAAVQSLVLLLMAVAILLAFERLNRATYAAREA